MYNLLKVQSKYAIKTLHTNARKHKEGTTAYKKIFI
jgi:hypothetical protein